MTRKAALFFANQMFKGFGETRRITIPGSRSFLYLIGRRGSDNHFHCYGSGKSYDEAVINARRYLNKAKAQMELDLIVSDVAVGKSATGANPVGRGK